MKKLFIDSEVLASHIVVSGNTGTGKTQFITQLMHYARACGDCALVLDSKPEFIGEFYRPDLGDTIWSPRDERTVYWDLPNEVTDEIDATSTMRALLPTQLDNPSGKFFDEHGCKIFAFLVANYRPTCWELGYWLSHPAEIDRRVRGTEHEQTLTENAAPQRAGILGTMNQIGFTLRMMPKEPEDRKICTIREWANDPEGWIFVSNTADSREALRPLQTAWIDIAVRRVMACRQKKSRIWIFIDEMDTLNRSMGVLEGMTLMRDRGHPLVLGFQNFAQLERRYGALDARTIWSQAYTKLIMACDDAQSRKMLSDVIGDALYRRYKLSRGGRGGSSESGPEEFTRPVVMPSEIGALNNLHGYVLQRGEVVKIKLPYRAPVQNQPVQVERLILPQDVAPELEQAEPEEQEMPLDGVPTVEMV